MWQENQNMWKKSKNPKNLKRKKKLKYQKPDIFLKMEYWDLTLSILPSSEGYISAYTLYGVYGQIFNEINRVIISH